MLSLIDVQRKKSFHLLLSLVVFSLLLLFTLYTLHDVDATSNIRYVTTDGNCNGATPCYSDIQTGVDASAAGDEIRVAAGHYTGINNYGGQPQVVYIDRTVTIRGGYSVTNWSIADPVANPTILDAQQQGRVLVATGNDVTLTLSGLTIVNGVPTGLDPFFVFDPGGIYVSGARLNIENSRILSNTWAGIGIISSNGVLIEDSVIDGNMSTTPTINHGIGLHILTSEPLIIRRNSISNNINGPGIQLHSRNAIFEDNIVQGNSRIGLAIRGGLPGTGQKVEINRNHIVDNGSWGVFVAETATFTMTNNIITSNENIGVRLSGLEDPWNNPLQINGWLYHNTIADNGSTGIHTSGHVNLTLINNFLTNHNTAILTRQERSGNPYIIAAHTLFDGTGVYIDSTGGGVVIPTNDVIGQPAFVGYGDYRLTASSAAIDAGVDIGIDTDIDGNPRPVGDAPDIGAYEFIPLPRLEINYTIGAPGSYFVITGHNFPVNEVGSVSINSAALGTVPISENGELAFLLSTANADEGMYFVTVNANPTATVGFVLSSGEPVRPQEGEGPIIEVPAGLAFTEHIFLPVITR
jgi:hypothetical protein